MRRIELVEIMHFAHSSASANADDEPTLDCTEAHHMRAQPVVAADEIIIAIPPRPTQSTIDGDVPVRHEANAMHDQVD